MLNAAAGISISISTGAFKTSVSASIVFPSGLVPKVNFFNSLGACSESIVRKVHFFFLASFKFAVRGFDVVNPPSRVTNPSAFKLLLAAISIVSFMVGVLPTLENDC